MKVVINSCYGGFSLSPKAIRRLAELNGKNCYFFSSNLGNEFIPISEDEANRNFFMAFSVHNPNEYLHTGKRWIDMSDAEKREHNRRYKEIELKIRPEDRTDPKLVQVVEELGSGVASGQCADLTVVEIPDYVDFEIEEYDGSEWISEKHRTWR